jgi:HPt (histidine-containing phosphotransfer) domain-containing protein
MTKKNILLIEQNPVNQIITKKFLDKLGYQYFVSDTSQNIDSLENNVDLILLNSQNVKEVDFSKIEKPIIGILDNNLESEKDLLRNNGISSFLVRPFSINLLKKRIEDFSKKLPNEKNNPIKKSSFDKVALDSLREAFGDDGIKDLINVYLKTFDETVESIIEKLETKNYEDASSYAHSLKSSTLSLGGSELGELCKKIEHNTDEEPIDLNTIQEMKNKSSEFKSYLEEVLKS